MWHELGFQCSKMLGGRVDDLVMLKSRVETGLGPGEQAARATLAKLGLAKALLQYATGKCIVMVFDFLGRSTHRLDSR